MLILIYHILILIFNQFLLLFCNNMIRFANNWLMVWLMVYGLRFTVYVPGTVVTICQEERGNGFGVQYLNLKTIPLSNHAISL